jgi:tetratricopeptide (TPR) repeat protein
LLLASLIAVGLAVAALWYSTNGPRTAAGNLAFLRAVYAKDPADQQAYREEAERLLPTWPVEGAGWYRRAQLTLAPVRSCPALGTGESADSLQIDGASQAELARWIEDSSVIPVCLGRNEVDAAGEYYAWAVRSVPGVAQHFQHLPSDMARSYVERAYERFDGGDSGGAQSDWMRAQSYLPAASYEGFGDIAEKLAAQAPKPHRGAQQRLLAGDVARAGAPDAARIYLSQAYNETASGRQALEAIEPLRRARPEDSRVWEQYGQALVNLNRFAEAEGALRTAARLAPGDIGPLNRLGVLYMAWGKYGEAESVYLQALKIGQGSESYWLWEHLGDALVKEGKRQEAAGAYTAALTTAPPEHASSARAKLANITR